MKARSLNTGTTMDSFIKEPGSVFLETAPECTALLMRFGPRA
jgi:hypothetical protein